jgi:rubredoxin
VTEQQPDLLPSPTAAISPADQAKRDEYRRRLAEYLKDPDFRAIEGFPIGTDEDILALSDPPYYTACPNPFLPEIIAGWQQERKEMRKKLGLDSPLLSGEGAGGEVYQREPYATDVSEGKNHPIYNAHSYHTKVPHKAIMRYILHYTDPGDIVFDGFCGTGMTGVAAQLCGDKKAVEELGYVVDEQGFIWEGINRDAALTGCFAKGEGDKDLRARNRRGEGDGKRKLISRLGARKAVLNDLSPAATFIAYNYNTPVDAAAFEREARRILREVEQECGWMYETWHPNCDATNRIKGKINFTVWSDVYACPQCGKEMAFWDVAIDHENKGMRENWQCPGCGASLAKNPRKDSHVIRAERSWETVFDKILGNTTRRAKQIPVIINYNVGKKRLEKHPDQEDLAKIQKIVDSDVPRFFPDYPIPVGYNTQQPMESHGIFHVHQFYTRRNLWVLAELWKRVNFSDIRKIKFWFTSSLAWCGRENRLHIGNYFGRTGGVITSLRGTWYIASLSVETNVLERFGFRLTSSQYKGVFSNDDFIVMNESATSSSYCLTDSIDYIFVDPPFGANLMYSELNIAWEAWLKVFSNNRSEAIINSFQKKGLSDYQSLMEGALRQFYRLLKPGRWMTIEFHNSQNAVWNAIQEGILRVGFMVAVVLNKSQPPLPLNKT